MPSGWESLGERPVGVAVEVPLKVEVRREGARFAARVRLGAVELKVTSATRAGAVRGVEHAAAVALRKFLAA